MGGTGGFPQLQTNAPCQPHKIPEKRRILRINASWTPNERYFIYIYIAFNRNSKCWARVEQERDLRWATFCHTPHRTHRNPLKRQINKHRATQPPAKPPNLKFEQIIRPPKFAKICVFQSLPRNRRILTPHFLP